MTLVNQGGSLLLRNGALATGAACCCNKCSGPCPNGVSECAPGCGCKDSQCVPCSGPCDTSCYVAYCCSPDGQCGPNGDACADALGCQERWNAPAFFATGAEAQEFADNFNADNPLWQFGCGMYVSTSQALGLECPPEKQSNPCPEGCECVDGQCVPNLLP